jgi:hypothetical protein
VRQKVWWPLSRKVKKPRASTRSPTWRDPEAHADIRAHAGVLLGEEVVPSRVPALQREVEDRRPREEAARGEPRVLAGVEDLDLAVAGHAEAQVDADARGVLDFVAGDVGLRAGADGCGEAPPEAVSDDGRDLHRLAAGGGGDDQEQGGRKGPVSHGAILAGAVVMSAHQDILTSKRPASTLTA